MAKVALPGADSLERVLCSSGVAICRTPPHAARSTAPGRPRNRWPKPGSGWEPSSCRPARPSNAISGCRLRGTGEPQSWPLEMVNVLLTAARKGTLQERDLGRSLQAVMRLPVRIDVASVDVACGAVAVLGKR